jgi:subtilisin family serine protease
MTVATIRNSTTFRRSHSVAVATFAAVAILLPAAASPAAAASDDGLWYFDALNVQAAHDAGWTGEGVKIAVMDSPVNMEVPTLANANVDVREPSYCQADDGSGYMPAKSTALSGQAGARHGTNVLSLISGTGDGYPGQQGVKGVAPGAEVLYYSILGAADGGGAFVECRDEDGDKITDVALAEAMNDAMDAGARIISVSALTTPGEALYAAQIRAVREGVIVVGGLSNTTDATMSAEWPGVANGAVGVQAADATATIPSTVGFPNTNPGTTVIAPGVGLLTQATPDSWEEQRLGTGTSFATPIVAGFLALVAQKYPDATGNQLLQTLIHNTGAEDHPLTLDPTNTVGYGFISATHMLRVDPAQYPDENPLIRDNEIPTAAEIEAGYEAGTEPQSASPSAAPEESVPAIPVGLIAGIVVGVLVVGGGIILIVVLAVRRSKRAGSVGATTRTEGE